MKALHPLLLTACLLGAPAVPAAELGSVPARAASAAAATAFDGVVEAVRSTVLAAQVAGAIVQLNVKAGDRVSAGQVLLRIDARAAEQNAAASEAQVQAARAALALASQGVERQRQLFRQHYISQAALDQAEAQFQSTQAQVKAQLAQSGAALTQSGLHVLRAPFAGVVAEVPVALGDMALPGRPLVALYDPSALRVTVAVPQTVATRLGATPTLPRVELPGLPGAAQWVVPLRAQLLPTVDPSTHTVTWRAELPAQWTAQWPGVVPGLFARLWLPMPASSAAAAPVSVALGAVVRRAEMTGLYVIGPDGKPVLRQVRLGRADGQHVEVLSGLMPGERVVTDPQAAARVR